MFEGFGLFGTGIGTGIMGKIEDMALGIEGAAMNAKNSLSSALAGTDTGGDSTTEKSVAEQEKEEWGFIGDPYEMMDTQKSILKDNGGNVTLEEAIRICTDGETSYSAIFGNALLKREDGREYIVKWISDVANVSEDEVRSALGITSDTKSKETDNSVEIETGIADIMQYLSGNQEFLTLLVSARNGKLSGREFAVKINEMKDNANVELDFGKMLSDRINKKESSDNFSKEWGTFLAGQPEEVKAIIWEKIKEAQKNLLEEISFLEEIIGFAKKEQAGKLSQKDMARASKNIARWKECIEKAKHKERELRLHSELQDEKQEVSLEEVEQALSAIKEQVGTI